MYNRASDLGEHVWSFVSVIVASHSLFPYRWTGSFDASCLAAYYGVPDIVNVYEDELCLFGSWLPHTGYEGPENSRPSYQWVKAGACQKCEQWQSPAQARVNVRMLQRIAEDLAIAIEPTGDAGYSQMRHFCNAMQAAGRNGWFEAWKHATPDFELSEAAGDTHYQESIKDGPSSNRREVN